VALPPGPHRRILFVDDEPAVLQAMQRWLRRRRGDWDMVFANGGKAAMAELGATPFDVVVTDGRMPDVDGIALVKWLRVEHPLTVRIMLSGYADDEAMIPMLPAIYQFLSKPCEPRVLESVLDAALEVSRIESQAVREALLASDWLPPGPRLYRQLTLALNDSGTPTRHIYGLIERDASLTSVLLKTVNSAYFGLRREVSSVAEAARLLGVITIRCLALFVEAFDHLDTQARLDRAYIDWFQAHSFATARITQALTQGTLSTEKSFTAGLLHDMGALLVATRMPEDHARARAMVASGVARTIHEAEPQGRTHAEIGGWLLSHWGLPAFIVEAASRHHGPVAGDASALELATAVHIADFLAVELVPGPEGASHAQLDPVFLQAAGGAHRLDDWRKLAARVVGNSG
jgi:HD-like signal output (HDOD) protein